MADAQQKLLKNIIHNFFPGAVELDKNAPYEQEDLKFEIHEYPYNSGDTNFLIRTVTGNIATVYQRGENVKKFKMYSEERGDHWTHTMNLCIYYHKQQQQ